MALNDDVIQYAQAQINKPIFKMMFGVYTEYFRFIPKRLPSKKIDLAYCWSAGSERRGGQSRLL